MRTEYETIITAYTYSNFGFYTAKHVTGKNARKMHMAGMQEALQHMQDHDDVHSVCVTTQATAESMCANYDPYSMCRQSNRAKADNNWTHTDF